MASIDRELDEAQAAHRAHLGALREMLAQDSDQLEPGTSQRLHNTVVEILRLQRVIAQLGQ
jgi:hypothetical protein